MESIIATQPLKLVHIDYLCLEPGKEREHPGSDGALHLVCPGICHSISDGLENGQGLMEQFCHPLWIARENPFGPGEELKSKPITNL